MSEEDDNQSEIQQEKPETERKFIQEQYDMLKRCSDKKDITEWDEWRDEHGDEEILLRGANLEGAWLMGANLKGAHLRGANLRGANLEGADLGYAHLEGADLMKANLKGADLGYAHLEGAWLMEANLKGADLGCANLKGANLMEANLEGANLKRANLQGADLMKTNLKGAKPIEAKLEGADLEDANLKGANLMGFNLEGANLRGANLEGADLGYAHLEGADLMKANLKGADLEGAHLEGAHLMEANLEGANLGYANLEGAWLMEANLKGADLKRANLQGACISEANLKGAKLSDTNIEGANFELAIVDGATLIKLNEGQFDRQTYFSGVGLNNTRVEPSTKQLLEYNIRRLKWEEWYKGNAEKKWKTWIRSAVTFPVHVFWWVSNYGLSTGRIALTFFSLAILFALVYYFVPGIVSKLHVTGSRFSDLIRACYFSIVTMTTLGFGDMYAEPGSKAGHILLILQVLLGYILLAALVTRFAVLFTAGGPAGSFPKKKSKKVNETKRDKNTKDQS